MKKLLAIAIMLSGFLFIISCNDDDPVNLEPPTVTAPSATSVQVGGTISLDFPFNAPAGFASSTATGGTITTDGTAAATSGTITVEFTAGTSAGAAIVTVEVTDAEGDKDEASVPITITLSPVPAIEGIPAAASLVEGQTLTVPGVDLEAEDGFASFEVTVNGGSPIDLSGLITAGATSATVEISATTEDLGATEGINTLVFTLEDADGDVATVTHILTVAGLAFDVVEEISDNGTPDDESDDFLVSREITGSINSDYTLTNDVPWILAGRVKVTNGAKLTIEEGSVLKGREGTGGNATALLITRGSYIYAEGTATKPIIMTSINDDLTTADVAAGDFVGSLAATVNGQWGGLIVLGDAPISASADEVQIEGIPTSDADGLYGGTNENHNAGIIKYVSVRHGGSLIGAGNEINGITFGGVGSGTVVENVEVVGNQDDGIEWFGGSVDVSNVVVWNAFDDGLDTDQDWQGTCSNFIVVTPDGSAFELDGPEGDPARNGGFHQFAKGTIYAGNSVGNIVDWDSDTNAGVSNIYVYGLPAAYTTAIASFGGDGSGTTESWQVTLTDGTVEGVFGTGAAAIITEVAANANTVGVQDETGFEWTMASQDGGLSGIGL